jgi:hypothetical protein
MLGLSLWAETDERDQSIPMGHQEPILLNRHM